MHFVLLYFDLCVIISKVNELYINARRILTLGYLVFILMTRDLVLSTLDLRPKHKRIKWIMNC